MTEKERELPAKKGNAPEPEREELSARPRPGGTRCPFCHESCEADAESCACAECLSRHHRRCWDENRASCASCRATRRLEVPAAARKDDAGYSSAIDAWLKLWLVYNAGLTLITLLCANVKFVQDPMLFAGAIFGAIFANIPFVFGPAVELFARRLGYRGAFLRHVVFALGFGFAAIVTIASCLSLWLK